MNQGDTPSMREGGTTYVEATHVRKRWDQTNFGGPIWAQNEDSYLTLRLTVILIMIWVHVIKKEKHKNSGLLHLIDEVDFDPRLGLWELVKVGK